MENNRDEVARNLKIGIVMDLFANGLITQGQMEQAVSRINQTEQRKRTLEGCAMAEGERQRKT